MESSIGKNVSPERFQEHRLDDKGDGTNVFPDLRQRQKQTDAQTQKSTKIIDERNEAIEVKHHKKEDGEKKYPDTHESLCNECAQNTDKETVDETQSSAESKDTNGSQEHDNNVSSVPDQSKPITFSDPRQYHVFNILSSIQNLRKSEQFADVVVKVEEQEFRCHRFVLSSSSFFGSLLEKCRLRREKGDTEQADAELLMTPAITVKEMTEESRNSSLVDCVVIKGMKPEIFSKVIDYMYCVFDDLFTGCNCIDLLLAAEVLKLSDLSRICADYVVETLNIENVFDVIKVCDTGCLTLHAVNTMKSCLQVLRRHFSSITNQSQFLNLGSHHMKALVADTMLNVANEMETISAAIRWVKHKPAERCVDLTLMLQHIRFPLLSLEELEQLKAMGMLCDNSLALALLEESRSYSLLDCPERLAWPRQNCISRVNFSSRDFLIWTAYRDKGLHLLSIVDGVHYQIANFRDETVNNIGFAFDSTATVCCYDNKLIFTGGEFNTDLAWSLDSRTGEVAVLPKMPRGRKFHSAVTMCGWVYCLGGQDKRGYSVLDSVDAYHISKGVWLKVGHLAVGAYNMATVCSRGAIYMVGGVDNSGQQLRIVQCFVFLRSGLYSAFKMNIDNMPPSLLSARVVVSGFQANVYIVCGHGEIYKLDADEKLVHHVATLKSLSQDPRVQFGASHIGGYLVITGGHQLSQMSQRTIRSLCWDINGNKEIKDFLPMLPVDIVNSCLTVKLNSNILSMFQT